MHVTTIDRYLPEPGEFLSWSVDATNSVAQDSAVPPSFNQTVHLSGAGEHRTWLATAFDVPGSIDRCALARAYHALVTRHGTLHSAFATRDDAMVRTEHDPARLMLIPNPAVRESDSAALQRSIWSAMDAACDPFDFPAYLLGAIDRSGRSTILCGFDHSHVDAYSMSIIVDDLHRLYHGYRLEPASFSADQLSMSGSFVDYCATEATTTDVASTDPRLRAWMEFFGEHHGRPPTFPLDLGLAPGDRAAQGVDVRHLLGTNETQRLAALCRRNGSSLYGGVLSAMAHAVRDLGGGPDLAMLFPMHTRRSEPWYTAVGWFTTNAPLTVVAHSCLQETIRRTGPELRRAMRLGGVPISQVINSLGGLDRVRDDIFMVSYVDYRTLPGARLHAEVDAQHISTVTTADDAQFWISRTSRGLALRCRYPDTDIGCATIRSFVDRVGAIVEQAARSDKQPDTAHLSDASPLWGRPNPVRTHADNGLSA
ncbi:condensation domain-containing protein [Gordonia sp. CPCC 206044]|uniref:condensation domain-containing protein n=1 Tax=Gordonia sp. CPCC 206044 TaxID=3140793 RepID=UPI003AF389EF